MRRVTSAPTTPLVTTATTEVPGPGPRRVGFEDYYRGASERQGQRQPPALRQHESGRQRSECREHGAGDDDGHDQLGRCSSWRSAEASSPATRVRSGGPGMGGRSARLLRRFDVDAPVHHALTLRSIRACGRHRSGHGRAAAPTVVTARRVGAGRAPTRRCHAGICWWGTARCRCARPPAAAPSCAARRRRPADRRDAA